MKHLPTIAGVLLGLAFVTFGLNFFLNFIPMPNDSASADAPHKLFLAAMLPTGYLAFVKILEIIGGLLVAIPGLRHLGLLILGPIVVNILSFHIFLRRGETLIDPVIVVLTTLALFLVWSERNAFLALFRKGRSSTHDISP